jgi:hypothetical protein
MNQQNASNLLTTSLLIGHKLPLLNKLVKLSVA